jgi:hypothetical protein
MPKEGGREERFWGYSLDIRAQEAASNVLIWMRLEFFNGLKLGHSSRFVVDTPYIAASLEPIHISISAEH